MISFQPNNDYQRVTREHAACACDITHCENCGHAQFIRYETVARYCMADEAETLRIGDVEPTESKIEYYCEDCGLEHKDWQFREIAW